MTETKGEHAAKRQRVSPTILDVVPAHVTGHLLTFLSTSELWSVESVAKPLKNLIQIANKQRTTLVLDETVSKAMSSAFNAGRLIQWLKFAYGKSRVAEVQLLHSGVPSEFLSALSVAFPEVKKLHAIDTLAQLPRFSKLEHLVCYRASLNLDMFPLLTSLSSSVPSATLARWSRLPQLTTLHIAIDLDKPGLSSVFERCASLRRLTLYITVTGSFAQMTVKLEQMFRLIGTTLAAACPDLEFLGVECDVDIRISTGFVGWQSLRALKNIRIYSCRMARSAPRDQIVIISKQEDGEMRKTLQEWTKLDVLSLANFGVLPEWFETDLEVSVTFRMSWLSFSLQNVYDLALIARAHVRFPRWHVGLPAGIRFSLVTTTVDWAACCERFWKCCEYRASWHSAAESHSKRRESVMAFRLLLECKTLDVLCGLVPFLVAAPSMTITGSVGAEISGNFLRSFKAGDQHMVTSVTLDGQLACEPAELDEFLFACRRLKTFTLGEGQPKDVECKMVTTAAQVIQCLSAKTNVSCEYQRVVFTRWFGAVE